MNIPPKLNGYFVIHHEPRPNWTRQNARIVVCWLKDQNPAFVVATWTPDMGTGWHQGDYVSIEHIPAAIEGRR